jgi:hypothetical protein
MAAFSMPGLLALLTSWPPTPAETFYHPDENSSFLVVVSAGFYYHT